MKERYYFIIIILSCCFSLSSYSQSLSVNMDFLNDYYRRQQLVGNIDSSISFSFRPLFTEALRIKNIYDPGNSLEEIRKSSFDGIFSFHKGKGRFQLLPISLLNQFNSHHPEGINDGSMIPSKGTQLRVSAGFYFKYGPLSIKFKPEFVYAQNKDFEGFPSNYRTSLGIQFPEDQYLGSSFIDLPERFGKSSYKKAFWGQSSIRLTLGSLSMGLSNENLWWGPGYRSSLLMTNSAPGFLHFTFNTVKPIKTIIGSFEGQIIGGKLEGSRFTYGVSDYNRYINAMVLSYQPKWVTGLFLGVTRSFQVYRKDMGNSFGDYFPVIIPLSKSSSGTNDEVNSKKRNQLISLFMRWIFSEFHAEVYFEYGREDHSWDLKDFILEPSHSSAYVLGMRKLFSINKTRGETFQIILEVTQLASNQTTINRGGGSSDGTKAYGGWYLHSSVKHGYTHNGQLLGAGIGPGSNLQTLHLSWNQSLKQIGIEFERYVHNNDFWYNYIRDFRSNWVDLSATIFAHWDYKNFLLSGKMRFVNSNNYQWLYEPTEIIPGEYWLSSDDTFNFHLQVGITYRF